MIILIRLINLLPVRARVFVISKIFNLIIFYRDIWMNYYMRILVRTGNYYKTLSIINSNVFAPADFYSQFIEEVRSSHKDLIHS
jgi:hypothetical protein